MRKRIIAIALLVMLVVASPLRAETTSAGAIAQQLVCQCGCTLILPSCNHSECASRSSMMAVIEQKLAQGQSEGEIIQYFVAQYGEQVLASPPKRGFNLVAWVTPFVAILAGAGVIYLAVRAWVRRGKSSPASDLVETTEGDEKYQRQLEEELQKFAERGFR